MGEQIHVDDVPDVPSGNWYAKIIKYEKYEGKYDPAARIFFMIKVGEIKVGPINGLFPLKATVANKTGKLLFATIGECTVDLIYDMDILIDKRCWVEVVRSIGDEGPISRVKKVIYPPPNAAAMKESLNKKNVEKPADTKEDDVFDDKGDMPF